MTVIPINRQRKGIPAGGQFAATAHAEPALSLAAPVRGRRAAPANNRNVPESLLMAHFQDPGLVNDLEWQIETSLGVDDRYLDYKSETFGDTLGNLHYEEAANYFHKARDAKYEGGDWKAVLVEAAAADTAAHPGGILKPGYRPPLASHQDGYQQGTLTTGANYTGYRDATEICKDIREELKKATAANYLPAGLKYSVTNDKYSGGQAIHVSIQGVSDADRLDPTELDHRGDYATRAEAKELRARVEAITNAWNRTDIDSMSDYYNVAYSGSADIEDDRNKAFRESEAARRKAARDARANR